MLYTALKIIYYTLRVCGLSLSHVQLFCDPLDCGPQGSSIHGIFQARILEWDVISFSTLSILSSDFLIA